MVSIAIAKEMLVKDVFRIEFKNQNLIIEKDAN